MAKSPILGGFGKSRSPNLADSLLTNLIVEIVESKDGKAPGALYNAAGLDLVATAGSGPVRGVHDLNGLLYVVSGEFVYSLTQNGAAVNCGSIGLQSSPVSMFDNGQQLMIVDGVGGWVVPGGYPLAGGTIAAAGGLYALNDTITLQGTTGKASSFPILTVTGISNQPVISYQLTNAGTTYSTATNVATTPIPGNPGAGSGLTLDITASGGPIASIAIHSGGGGTGYAVGNTGTILTGTQDATYLIKSVSGGVVTALYLTYAGSHYAAVSGAATAAGPGAPTNIGQGFTIDVTASSGPVTASTLHSPGHGYAVGNIGFVSGGTGDAIYLVTQIGANGGVSSFSISQPGALIDEPIEFTQKATSGSGSGLIIQAPSFGSFVGVVPIVLPFEKPIMGVVSDGFGLLVFEGSQNIAQSDELDLSTWDPLAFGVANQSPDKCLAIGLVHDEVYVLKEKTTEVWVDEGEPGFAFGPLNGVHMESGSAAPFSLAKLGETLIWLSRNEQGQGIVVQAKGYNLEPISTQALATEFAKYANIGDAIGYAFQQDQHLFYVLTFPEANATWQYDFTSSQLAGYPIWSRLGAWKDGQLNRHWGNCFWNWKGVGAPISTTQTYQALGVQITSPTLLQTASGLVGLPPSYHTALMSVWALIPDGSATGFVFSNQADDTHGTTNPGLFVMIQNDATGTPQITVEAWDASNASIVTATYDFSTWTTWVNILISIDTATQVLQVYANTIVSNLLVETHLSPASIAWHSTNAIAQSATRPWHLAVVA